jgi:hypothetical protein
MPKGYLVAIAAATNAIVSPPHGSLSPSFQIMEVPVKRTFDRMKHAQIQGMTPPLPCFVGWLRGAPAPGCRVGC